MCPVLSMASEEDRPGKDFTIEDFLARTRASPSSLKSYRDQFSRLEARLGKPLAVATLKDLARLKRDHLSKLEAGYHLADLLKMFYRRSKRPDLDDIREVLAMDRKKKRLRPSDLLSAKEVQAMVDATPTLRDKAFLAVLWETAARVHEVLALDLADVKVQESRANGGRKIYVVWLKKTKIRGEEHEGYVIEAVKVLEAWLATRRGRASTSPLFPSWGGGRMTPDGALHVVKASARRAGIEKRVYNHLFRHSRATWALAAGMTEAQVKALYGWSPGSTMLAKYSHIVSRDAKSGLLKTLGLEPEKVEVERLSFDDDRLKPAVPMLAPPGANVIGPRLEEVLTPELRAELARPETQALLTSLLDALAKPPPTDPHWGPQPTRLRRGRTSITVDRRSAVWEEKEAGAKGED